MLKTYEYGMNLDYKYLKAIFDGNADNDGAADPQDDGDEGGSGGNADDEKKYSQADVDRIVKDRLARERKNAGRKTSEAEKLAQKNAEDRMRTEKDDLQQRIQQLEEKNARNEMMATARGILQAENLNVPDNLVANLIVVDDADRTDENIKAFIKQFRAAVAAQVKATLSDKGRMRSGSSSAQGENLTKDDIRKVKDPIERQRLIRKNMKLFQK